MLNTLVIFSSDNGPVLDDGYEDGAVTQLNGHSPWGPLRGGKYSVFEAGTRVPMMVSWPETIKPMVSEAMISQVDLLASFSKLLKVSYDSNTMDSKDALDVLMGKSLKGREYLVEQGLTDNLAIRHQNWKYIEPSEGPAIEKHTKIELGKATEPQLYDLDTDIGETKNLANKYPKKVKALQKELNRIKNRG